MWKDIKGWEKYYEVSDYGEVRNKLTGHIVKGDTNNVGYHRVCLYNKNNIPCKQRFFRHRLVAEHFIDNPNNLPEVNHKNHNLADNFELNLEWCTREENELDSRLRGSKKYSPFKVIFENDQSKIYHTRTSLAKELNVSSCLIKLWLYKNSFTFRKYGIKSIEYI